MDFVCADNYRPLIPEGKYEAVCTKYEDNFCFMKARKLFLHFKIITPGEYQGTELFQSYNMPYNGKMKLGSKYYKTWCMVNGWKIPTRNAKMSPRFFLNKAYVVNVRTVKPQHNGGTMPKDFYYSVIDQIILVNTGAV